MPTNPFTLEIIERNHIRVVRITGDVNAESCSQFRETLLSLPAQGHGQVLLDVEKLHYINSMGIGAIVETHKQLARAEGALVLMRPGRDLTGLLKILRLDRLLPVVDDFDQALQYFLKRKLV